MVGITDSAGPFDHALDAAVTVAFSFEKVHAVTTFNSCSSQTDSKASRKQQFATPFSNVYSHMFAKQKLTSLQHWASRHSYISIVASIQTLIRPREQKNFSIHPPSIHDTYGAFRLTYNGTATIVATSRHDNISHTTDTARPAYSNGMV